MGCTFERNGYTNFASLTRDLVTVLSSNGFVVKYPSAADGGITAATTKFTLESSTGIDPLSDTSLPEAQRQPWRIHFDCSDPVTLTDPGTLRVYMGTHIQLPNNGEIATAYYGTIVTTLTDTQNLFGKYPRKSGELTSGYYTFDLIKVTTGVNPQSEMPIPFASKMWGKSTIIERETDGTIPANPTDADVNMLGADLRAVPISFRATMSDHGLALVVWEEGEDLWGERFSWFVVQRPVNPDTGIPLTNTGAGNPPLSRCPVFCVYSIGGGKPSNTPNALYAETPILAEDIYRSKPKINTDGKIDDYFDAPQIYQFVVREIDINRPSIPLLATVDTPDHKAIINGKQQVSITEGNQYVISFINDINTDRYLYKEELDMITYASADVISMWSDITLKPYQNPVGTDVVLKYKAMHANMPNNAGMRILILTNGNGVSGECSSI